jgi:hypothetical protein
VLACSIGLLALGAIAPMTASADVVPTVSTSYEYNTPGNHGYYTITQTFSYNGSTEPAAGTEDLKKWIIDSPPGLVGNPNAVPTDQRCTLAQFDPVPGAASSFFNSSCPASSKVGTATVAFVTDAASGSIPAGTPLPPISGDIFLLQESPEVPTTLATKLNTAWSQNVPGTPCASPAALPCPLYPKTKSIVQPVTNLFNGGQDADFRLRTIPAEDSTRPFTYGPVSSGFPAGAPTPMHIRSITYHLIGLAPNNNVFLTHSTDCGPWKSRSYATAYDSNSAPNYDPDPDPTHNDYNKSTNVDEKTVDCSTLPTFAPAPTTTFSTAKRDTNPQVDFVVNNASVDIPKKVVTTLPASLTTDIQGIANLCSPANKAAGTCLAASKVGTVKIDTPLISGGLTGDVHIVQGTTAALPNLVVFIRGAINFNMEATNTFGGPKGNQIISTFDNLPQAPFSKFTLTINGGKDTLLTISPCPDGNASPPDGDISWSLTGFSGQAITSTNKTSFYKCKKVKVKRLRCVRKVLKVAPTYQSRSSLKRAVLYINGKKAQTQTRLKTKFIFKKNVKDLANGKKKITVRAFYKDGHKSKASSTFRKCS